MKAMIFAAGLGTRLRPLTDSMPKALVPVHGVPMLQHVITNLKNAGAGKIIVNTHHFPDMIADFLNRNNNFGIDIAVSDERDLLLDTGGGIVKAASMLDGDEPFIVHNADIFTDVNLREIYERHIKSGSDATLLVGKRSTSRYLLFDGDLRMSGWINNKTGEVKPAGLNSSSYTEYAFNGIHVISPGLLPILRGYRGTGTPFSITSFYIDNCSNCTINGFMPVKAYNWHDIGKPDSLEAANKSSGF